MSNGTLASRLLLDPPSGSALMVATLRRGALFVSLRHTGIAALPARG
jgi:hypothetical protein